MRACLAPDDFGYGLAGGVSGLQIMPVVYPVFSLLPAPENLPSIELAVEIHQPVLESLEHAADLLQLEQVVLDLARDGLDGAPQLELLLRLAPVGPRLRGGELVLVNQVTPLRVERGDVGNHSLNEREGLVGFGQGEMLPGHEENLKCRVQNSECGVSRVGFVPLDLTLQIPHSAFRTNL